MTHVLGPTANAAGLLPMRKHSDGKVLVEVSTVVMPERLLAWHRPSDRRQVRRE